MWVVYQFLVSVVLLRSEIFLYPEIWFFKPSFQHKKSVHSPSKIFQDPNRDADDHIQKSVRHPWYSVEVGNKIEKHIMLNMYAHFIFDLFFLGVWQIFCEVRPALPCHPVLWPGLSFASAFHIPHPDHVPGETSSSSSSSSSSPSCT